MKVLEIKNNLVKISYDVKDNLSLSSFIIIEDENSPYVAQVMNVKADAVNNFAIVKLLFTFNEEGILKNYNGTIPSLKASVSKLPSNELLDIIPVENPVIIGNLAQQDIVLKLDKSIFENNLLVCSNNLNNTSILLENFTKQLDSKVVVWDCEGSFDSENKIVLGKDFKLPLNYDSINFIYENELDDVDAISKAVIQDIFIELQEYIKTLPEGFLPFDTFLNVVDQQYKETNITQLVLLKNKLLKYKELNVFANTLKEIMDLNIALDEPQYSMIDISNMPSSLQKEAILHVYNVMEQSDNKYYSLIKIDNSNTNKKILKRFLDKENVFTTIVCPHEYKYLNELKENAQNLILFAPLTLQHDFASYNSYLNKLNANEFIIYGAHTQNIPFIVELNEIDLNNLNQESGEESEDEPIDEHVEDEKIDDEFDSFDEPVFEGPVIEEQPLEQDSDEEKIENILEDDLSEPEIVESSEDAEQTDEILNVLNDDDVIEIPELEVPEENLVVEEEPLELIEDDQEEHEELVEQVAKDVDRVFYEKLPEQVDEINFDENMLVDELTEDDLNLIDDVSNLDESDIFEEELPAEQEPILPIYEAETIETTQIFEPGERVSTAKHGEGVVEKMIKHGNKMLCYVNFPGIGRRLLDPAVTEMTKL